jgi:hypothetical protein
MEGREGGMEVGRERGGKILNREKTKGGKRRNWHRGSPIVLTTLVKIFQSLSFVDIEEGKRR